MMNSEEEELNKRRYNKTRSVYSYFIEKHKWLNLACISALFPSYVDLSSQPNL